jgi:hypothetical protein
MKLFTWLLFLTVITRGGLLMGNAFAMPEELEVWFLSQPEQSLTEEDAKSVFIQPLIFKYRFSKLTAQNNYKCIPMGDMCFDPQIGLYKQGADNVGLEAEVTIVEEEKNPLDGASSVDRKQIDCDKEVTQFDIFCGKAKKQFKGRAHVEMWIDVSSSMGKVDSSDLENSCFRRSLVKRLRGKCEKPEQLNIFVYNARTKKQLSGDYDQLCTNVGLNDDKRLIRWIEDSNAKKLIVITDIFELSKDFADFVSMRGGTIRGDDPVRPLDAESMLDLIPKVAKSCQKK